MTGALIVVASSALLVGFVAWGIWAMFTVSRSRWNSGWAIALGLCLGLWALATLRPRVPKVLFPLLVAALGISCEKLVRLNRSSLPADVLGLNGTLLKGHPGALEVEVAGGVWDADAPEGLVLLAGEGVIVTGNRGRRLSVARRDA